MLYFLWIIFGRFHEFLKPFVEVFGITIGSTRSTKLGSSLGRFLEHFVKILWKTRETAGPKCRTTHISTRQPLLPQLGSGSGPNEMSDGHNLSRGRSDIATLSGWWFQILYLQLVILYIYNYHLWSYDHVYIMYIIYIMYIMYVM